MADPTTSVDVPGMVAAQQKFQDALGQVNTAYKSMEEQQITLGANWHGETSSSFGIALTNWLDDFGVVQKQLVNLIEALASNTHVYANTAEASQQIADSFKNGMSGLAGLGI